MSAALRVGCCAEIAEPDWRWIADRLPPDLAVWSFFSTAPASALERRMRRPRLSRYRACRELAAAVKTGKLDLVVTHHPLVTAWTETFCSRRRACPHLAFAFNFTSLPDGLRLTFFKRAFATVDRFVVFSTFERALYSRRFEIPLDRIEMIPWGIRDPAARFPPRREALGNGRACAVGSQGRDYATLLEAMRRLPNVKLTLVATPESVRGLAIPPNVSLRTNVPRNEAEAVIRDSSFLVLPLANSEIPCGHVTIATGMFFSRAIVATDSAGTRDYLLPGQNSLIVPPKDPVALADAIERLAHDEPLASRLGEWGRSFAVNHCGEEGVTQYVRALLERLGTQGHI